MARHTGRLGEWLAGAELFIEDAGKRGRLVVVDRALPAQDRRHAPPDQCGGQGVRHLARTIRLRTSSGTETGRQGQQAGAVNTQGLHQVGA